MTAYQDLMPQPPATRLPADPEPESALGAGEDPAAVAARHPASSGPWAALAGAAWSGGRVIESYAYARVGYHRGLDALRRAGWKGHGPVPWSHEPNRGFLASLAALGRAAAAIGETPEAERCATFLRDCDPSAPSALEWPPRSTAASPAR